jgi:hypothetical protein
VTIAESVSSRSASALVLSVLVGSLRAVGGAEYKQFSDMVPQADLEPPRPEEHNYK